MYKKSIYYLLFTISLILIDQITKLVFSNRDFFVGPIYFHSVNNYGLAFSLNFGSLANITLVALGLFFLSYYYYWHRHEFSRREQMAFILIFAGAVSNIIDRLYLEYVRDFLDLGLAFTFNLADVFVAVGLLLILLPRTNQVLKNS